MGLFNLNATCAVCGKDAGLNRHRLTDKKFICHACYKKCGYAADTVITAYSEEEAKKAVAFTEDQASKTAAFTSTKKIGKLMEINEPDKQWLIYTVYGSHSNAVVFRYEDLIDFELLEDGTAIARGGLGQTVVSGMEEGVVSGIKDNGICTALKLKINVSDSNRPSVYVPLITAPIMKGNRICKKIFSEAQECLSELQLICNSVQGSPVNPQENETSAADEIWKFKGLLDADVITKEEFEAKKKQLLGL